MGSAPGRALPPWPPVRGPQALVVIVTVIPQAGLRPTPCRLPVLRRGGGVPRACGETLRVFRHGGVRRLRCRDGRKGEGVGARKGKELKGAGEN